VTLHVLGISLSQRESLVFAEELVGGGLKALAAAQLAAAVLDLKVEIPFLGNALARSTLSVLVVARWLRPAR
jgi:hypothetical protein